MGLSDLLKALDKGNIEMQGVTESRVVDYMINLLFDFSTDVQGAAVRWYFLFLYFPHF